MNEIKSPYLFHFLCSRRWKTERHTNQQAAFQCDNLVGGIFPIFGVLNAHYVRRVNFLRVGPFKTTYLNGNAGVWAGIKFTGHLAGIGFSGRTDLGKNHFEMGLGAASIIDQIVITTKKTTHLVSQINNRYYLKIILQFGLLLL